MWGGEVVVGTKYSIAEYLSFVVFVTKYTITWTRPVRTAVPPRSRLRVTMMLVKSPKTKTMMCVFPPYRDLIT